RRMVVRCIALPAAAAWGKHTRSPYPNACPIINGTPPVSSAVEGVSHIPGPRSARPRAVRLVAVVFAPWAAEVVGLRFRFLPISVSKGRPHPDSNGDGASLPERRPARSPGLIPDCLEPG